MRDLLERIFSKEKTSGDIPGSNVNECGICFCDIKSSPKNAAIYIRCPFVTNAPCYENERDRMLRYCGKQGYNPIVIFESLGKHFDAEDHSMERIRELAALGIIDVVILPAFSRLTDMEEEVLLTLNALGECGIRIDCIGYGILEPEIIKLHLLETQRQSRELAEILRRLIGLNAADTNFRSFLCALSLHSRKTFKDFIYGTIC